MARVEKIEKIIVRRKKARMKERIKEPRKGMGRKGKKGKEKERG